MSGNPRHTITHSGRAVGALFEMPWHGAVCLHTEDADLLNVILEAGLVTPRRPPFLDAAEDGVHGAYHPRPQINLFFADDFAEVVRTLRPTLEEAGYGISEPAPARS